MKEQSKNTIQQLFEQSGFDPTSGQADLFKAFDQFWTYPAEKKAFLLGGYAGTGKTTVIKVISQWLAAQNHQVVMLAPTGRAAQVMTAYSGQNAFTIHKKIYWGKKAGSLDGEMRIQANTHFRTLFVVDEASMISGQYSQFLGGSLLDHLVQYVYNNKQCYLMLLGDLAQLPPVGTDQSPALSRSYLEQRYGLTVFDAQLTEVVRQAEGSGILANATWLRQHLDHGEMPTLSLFEDVSLISHHELEEEISTAYSTYGEDQTIVLTRSNYRCFFYNQQIRLQVNWMEGKLDGGDRLLVIRNNYFWTLNDPKIGFIANGEMIKLLSVRRFEHVHGFEFADVVCQLLDQPDQPEFEVKILMDALYDKGPGLDKEKMAALRSSVESDYFHITNKKDRWVEMKKDPYWNALQVKFGYAITGHKAQGGQWDCVFVDFPNFEEWNAESYRWLYTAVTRAAQKLYIVNMPGHES